MIDATAVILGGGPDFGRCPIATRLPRALWPIIGRPMLEYQLEWLRREGIGKATVCAAGRVALDRYGVEVRIPAGMEVRFTSEQMPRGTAGTVKDAAAKADGTVIVIKAGVIRVENLSALVASHRQHGAVLTAFTGEAPGQGEALLAPLGVYICEPAAIEAIPNEGYEDIKEQLIPALLKKGLPVRAAPLGEAIIAGRDVNGYLRVIESVLGDPGKSGVDLSGFDRRDTDVYVGKGAEVSEDARLYGPAVIMPEAIIEKGAVVIGPSVIGQRALVSSDCVVERSVVWDGGFIGKGALVAGTLLDRGAIVGPRRILQGAAVVGGEWADRGKAGVESMETPVSGSARVTIRKTGKHEHELSEGPREAYVVGAVCALAAFTWAYWEVLGDLWNSWCTNDNYSSGLLVPFLAAYVVYSQRKELGRTPVSPALWGLGLVIGGFAMRLAGTVLLLSSAERFSVVLVVAGAAAAIFGARMAWRLKWIFMFMALMFPWPHRIHNAVSLPLQNWATSSSVFVLELLGWVVIREGNVLTLNDTTVAVAEACSGLRMLTAFVTVSAFVALLVKRSWWEKVVIVLSSVPVAVVCNTIRLVVTAIAFDANYGPQVNKWFHDFGGLAMMPLAMVILGTLMWLMGKLAPVVPQAVAGARGNV